jgi:aminoglycoside 6'-N-acetyltransferase
VALKLPIRTARLVLRRFREDDRERFLAYRRHPDVARFQGWDADYPDDLADRFFAEMTTKPTWRVGEWFQIAIEHDGVLVGDIGVHAGEDAAELGWSLHPDSQGRGYASEAIRGIVAHLPVPEVVAWVDVANEASIRMAERLGFERGEEPIDGEWFYRLAIRGTSTFGP